MTTLMASNERVWAKYVAHDGTQYNISAKANVVGAAGNAAKLGYTAGGASLKSIPNGMRPRKVKCVSAGLPARYVVCYTEDATLWTTPGTTIDLFSHGNDATYTSTDGTLGERAERNIAQA
jgi:hypothetical protein